MSIYFILTTLMMPICFAGINFYKVNSSHYIDIDKIKKNHLEAVVKKNELVESINYKANKIKFQYTTNKNLEKKLRSFIRKYNSAHTGVAIIDNNTGEIKALIGESSRKNHLKIAFSPTNPAASIYKIITAADLLERNKVQPQTNYSFNGKGITLYKSQVLRHKKNRWTRQVPFRDAFAHSNNVVFARAAIKGSNFQNLYQTSQKFKFNEQFLQFFNHPKSSVFKGNEDFALGELASGYNRKTNMSVIHAVLLPYIIANDGLIKNPYIVKRVSKEGQPLWAPKNLESKRIISTSAARDLRHLMGRTVSMGTARKSFSKRPRILKNYIVGGKTGSLKGGDPFGKRDWFVSYFIPKNKINDKGFSIATMIVNDNKWYIKAARLTKHLARIYLEEGNS